MARLRNLAGLRWGIAAILLWTLLPGTWELVENVGHLLSQGHLAHAESVEHEHSEPGDEHGCSGTLHLCPCHVSPLGLLAVRRPSPPAPGGTLRKQVWSVPELLAGYGHPPERPPSA